MSAATATVTRTHGLLLAAAVSAVLCLAVGATTGVAHSHLIVAMAALWLPHPWSATAIAVQDSTTMWFSSRRGDREVTGQLRILAVGMVGIVAATAALLTII